MVPSALICRQVRRSWTVSLSKDLTSRLWRDGGSFSGRRTCCLRWDMRMRCGQRNRSSYIWRRSSTGSMRNRHGTLGGLACEAISYLRRITWLPGGRWTTGNGGLYRCRAPGPAARRFCSVPQFRSGVEVPEFHRVPLAASLLGRGSLTSLLRSYGDYFCRFTV